MSRLGSRSKSDAICVCRHLLRTGRDCPSRSGHEPSFKGPFEERLPQLAAAGEAGSDGGFDLIEDGEAALDFGDDSVLFLYRW